MVSGFDFSKPVAESAAVDLSFFDDAAIIGDSRAVGLVTNTQLKKIIEKIEVDKDGNVDIYLRLLGDLGLDETVLIRNDET